MMTHFFNSEQCELHRRTLLKQSQVLDTPIEERFERITRLAAKLFDVPICCISCVDENRVWFKSAYGIELEEVPREGSFCHHTVQSNGILHVQDSTCDDRFSGSPFVQTDNGLRFYAGAPIQLSNALDAPPAATLCLMDTKPRKLSKNELVMLEDFAQIARSELMREQKNQISYLLLDHIDEQWRQLLIDPISRLWNHEGIMTIACDLITNDAIADFGSTILGIDLSSIDELKPQLDPIHYQKLIRCVSEPILGMVREHDSIGRIADHQLVILFYQLWDQSSTLSMARRVEAKLNDLVLPVDLNQRIQQCIPGWDLRPKLGAVCIKGKWNNPAHELFEIFDETMDEAKRSSSGTPIVKLVGNISTIDTFDENDFEFEDPTQAA